MFYFSQPQQGNIKNGLLDQLTKKFNIVSHPMESKIAGGAPDFFKSFLNHGITLEKVENIYFAFGQDTSGKGVALFRSPYDYLNCSNLICDPDWANNAMTSCQTINSGFLAGDYFTGGNMCHVAYDHSCRAYEFISWGKLQAELIFYNTSWNWAKQLNEHIFLDYPVRYIKPKTLYFFKNLYFFSNIFTAGSFHPTVQMSSSYKNHLKALRDRLNLRDDTFPKKIYHNRISASARSITNEQELVEKLSSFGFSSIDTASMSFLDQLKTFYNADKIIAPHGAGLSNLFACRDSTQILEIFMEKNNNTRAYDIISSNFGLRYQHYKENSKDKINISDLLKAMS